MTFAELVAEVILLTRRPDLLERTHAAVKAGTLKLHQSDFFYRDLHEVAVEFGQEFIIQNFNPKDIFPTYRKAKYVRFWHDDINGVAGAFLEFIQIENSIDMYGCNKENVFYQAGQLLQIRTAAPIKRCLFGAYLHPVVTPAAQYSSWIADEYPYAVIYEAARQIFKGIGMDQQAAEMTQLAAEAARGVIISNVDDAPMT